MRTNRETTAEGSHDAILSDHFRASNATNAQLTGLPSEDDQGRVRSQVGSSDAFFVGVDKDNPTSAATADMNADGQVKSSAFLTVQSFTNFAAATGAISAAWQALKALNSDFNSTIWPFLLSIAWLATCLVTSYQAGAAGTKRASFWMSSLFLGLMNSLTLFAAVIGASTVAPGGL